MSSRRLLSFAKHVRDIDLQLFDNLLEHSQSNALLAVLYAEERRLRDTELPRKLLVSHITPLFAEEPGQLRVECVAHRKRENAKALVPDAEYFTCLGRARRATIPLIR